MLRALPGERTRTTYRRTWITDEMLKLLNSGDPFEAVTFLVDPSGNSSIPCRKVKLLEPPQFDNVADSWKFTLELGDFVYAKRRSIRPISEWPNSLGNTPPTKFVTLFNPEWIDFQEVDYRDSKVTWKRVIDFVIEAWPDFENTVFIRPSFDSRIKVLGSGAALSVKQSETFRLSVECYNPHLRDTTLRAKRLQVSIGDVMGEASSSITPEKDGTVSLSVRLLETGSALLQIDVRPDERFSAYLPFLVEVQADPSIDPSGPRILGPAWSSFLRKLVTTQGLEPTSVLGILDELSVVFPGDPEVLLRRGVLHLRDANYFAARKDLEGARSSRKDPEIVLASLLVALKLNLQAEVEVMLEEVSAIPSSNENQVLFESAIEGLMDLPDSTVEWFAELPSIIMGDVKALQMLLKLLRPGRQEKAMTSIVSAIAAINPERALLEARQALLVNPRWRALRREAASIALRSRLLAYGEEDAEVLLQYDGQDSTAYRELVNQVRDLVAADRLPALLLSNAIRLSVSEDSDLVQASMDIALDAAYQALSNGDVLNLERSILFLETRLMGSEIANRSYRSSINELIRGLSEVINESPTLLAASGGYQLESAAQLQEFYTQKKIVIFGGSIKSEEVQRLKDVLNASDVVAIGWNDLEPPDARKLREFLSSESVLLINSLDDGLIATEIRDWLRSQRVPQAHSLGTLGSVIDALRLVAESQRTSNEFLGATCAEAVEWARTSLQNLEFSLDVMKRINEIEGSRKNSQVIRRIIGDLTMLDRFPSDAQQGLASGGFKRWLETQRFVTHNFSANESDTTTYDPRLRGARTFRVPKEYDQSGFLYMPMHFRLPGNYPNEPRIHFSIDHVQQFGKVLIGYIGPHLPLS